MTTRPGISARWNASLEVMACSLPGTSGTAGQPPVATRMLAAVTFLSPTSTVCGSSTRARDSNTSTPAPPSSLR